MLIQLARHGEIVIVNTDEIARVTHRGDGSSYIKMKTCSGLVVDGHPEDVFAEIRKAQTTFQFLPPSP